MTPLGLQECTIIKNNEVDDDDEDDYDYEESSDFQENDMDEIDPNELGDLLQDTCSHMHSQGQLQESQESHNQQMISESESEEEFDPEEEEYQEEESSEEEQQSTTNLSEVQTNITRSGCVSRMPVRCQHLQAKTESTEEYTMDNARVLANTICHANYMFIQTYSLKAVIKNFGEQGRKAAVDEMKQIHDRVVFHPIRIDNMSETERKHAMESLMFLVHKSLDVSKQELVQMVAHSVNI